MGDNNQQKDPTNDNQPPAVLPPTPSLLSEEEQVNKAIAEAAEHAQEIEDAINKDIDAGMEPFELSIKHKLEGRSAIDRSIKRHYQYGHGSIQDIARVYNVTVEHVLKLNEIDDMTDVEVIGDQIDQDEAGQGAEMNNGKKFRVPYNLE